MGGGGGGETDEYSPACMVSGEEGGDRNTP